ncbi:hypothetical protein EPA93_46200 [Ktedonosporobacter rubrisoli]|uniref:Glycoside hydrolase family 38 N-terminal domain-containing protein n=1 Tax=Ktedonosporobacter rubrisoli TaxID=2509675 RepID=A0A4P6K5Y4_KTERU|nr:hypothetical protein [Ktedonosporobacter rubrisoli]QBD82966.1 hypothetical protein EPA93_46200 [Ktedonosporobacter rubrisoli]
MLHPFTFYVTQSAHTDIGYTHPQEQIQQMYIEFYDQVLDICHQTENDPPEHRFKWTCETFWQVEHYLTTRPEREAEFQHYVRSGQIEIMATYLHFTDLIDADAYRRSIELAVSYCQRHDLPLRCAMHSDINGWPWATADILAEYHIPYFCTHIHIDNATDPLGKRGSVHYMWLQGGRNDIRPDAPVRVPKMFWWQGPKGGRVLHWLSEHYNLGNALGISGTKGFGADKTRYFIETDRTSVDELYATAQREIPRYVERIKAEGYPYDRMQINTAGFFVDNSPPDWRWCALIARWNAEHDDIKLRTATPSEWFDDFQQHCTQNYPTYQVAWPDHWAHGLGSDTPRIALARQNQRKRADALALVELSGSDEARAALDLALDQERFALEHTFDAWSTAARPAAPFNEFLHMHKALNFYRADLYFNEAIGRSLRSYLPQQERRERQLHIGASQYEAGEHTIHFSSEDYPLKPEAQALRAENGTTYAFQLEDRELSQYVAALPIVHEKPLVSFSLAGEAAGRTQARAFLHAGEHTRIKTDAWDITVNPRTGHLLSLHERAIDQEWVNAKHQHGFGQLIHEQVVHPWKREAVGNRARYIALDIATEQLAAAFPPEPIVTRSSIVLDAGSRFTQGPVFDEIALQGTQDNIGRVQLAWRGYHHLPIVEFVIDWEKQWSELPEAAYVAFPFAVAHALHLETGGGFFQPGSHESGGQLPGTCSSYYTIQRAARIANESGAALFWLPLDAPLVLTNEVAYNRWETSPYTWNGLLASMPVNHYWHTNFPISQRGRLRLRYRLISRQGFGSDEQAIQAAQPIDALGWC